MNPSLQHTILLVDDHPMMRHGIRQMLELEDDFEIVGEASHGEEALTLIEPLRPDPLGRPQTPASQQAGQPSPVEGVPGAYVQLPLSDPHVDRRVYESDRTRAPQTQDQSRELAEARARVRASMLCELTPATPRRSKG